MWNSTTSRTVCIDGNVDHILIRNHLFSMDESQVRLRNLDRDKLILEKDIETKTNTIFVDEVECHEGLRKSISVEDW